MDGQRPVPTGIHSTAVAQAVQAGNPIQVPLKPPTAPSR